VETLDGIHWEGMIGREKDGEEGLCERRKDAEAGTCLIDWSGRRKEGDTRGTVHGASFFVSLY